MESWFPFVFLYLKDGSDSHNYLQYTSVSKTKQTVKSLKEDKGTKLNDAIKKQFAKSADALSDIARGSEVGAAGTLARKGSDFYGHVNDAHKASKAKIKESIQRVEKGIEAGKGGENIRHPVLDTTRSGSALKKPDGQHGFNDIIDNYTQYATEFEIVGGDGIKRELYQIEGGMKYYDYKDVYNKDLRIKERITTVKDQDGIFEWIVDPTKGVTHRRFIPNGVITGYPNQRP